MESAAKRLKVSLKAIYGNQTMSLVELQLAFRKVSSLVNSRPVYAHAKPAGDGNSEYLQAITPNHLLLGRSSPEVHHPEWDALAGLHSRLSYVHDLTEAWWKQWQVHNLAELVPTRAWRVEQRAVQPGDIVLVHYDNKVAGNWKLARVLLQEASEDGLVRTVVARYSLAPAQASSKSGNLSIVEKPNRAKYIRVPVQRLAVILPAEVQDPLPSVSQDEVDAAIRAVGAPDPKPPRPTPRPAPDLPADPPQCLKDLFRIPDPAPSVPPARAAARPRQRNPRLPDPACSPPRTRAAARLQHHATSQCTKVWRERFSKGAALQARLEMAAHPDQVDHHLSIVSHIHSWLRKTQ